MSLVTYTPAASDATGLSRTFPAAIEPLLSAHNTKFATAKYVYKPLADELLKVMQSVYSTGTTQRTGFKNRIINGDFSAAQRGTTFTSTSTPANNDDAYLLDRWYMLTDGNDIFDVTQQLSSDNYEIRLDVETVNKKGGIAQIIEYKDCLDLIGNTVTLSFKAKVSSTTKLDNIKCAIVSWSGTADTVTSDIISAWGVEGTNPTLIANATYENTPANLNVTTSYATYSVSAAIDTASAKNIILFIWSDVTDTTLGDFIHVKDVQLELGATATTFDFRPFPQELALCQRYCWVYDGTADYSAGILANGWANSVSILKFALILPVSLRVKANSVTFSTASQFGGLCGAAAGTGSSFTYTGANDTRNIVYADLNVSGSPFTQGHGGVLYANSASAKITVEAEL